MPHPACSTAAQESVEFAAATAIRSLIASLLRVASSSLSSALIAPYWMNSGQRCTSRMRASQSSQRCLGAQAAYPTLKPVIAPGLGEGRRQDEPVRTPSRMLGQGANE